MARYEKYTVVGEYGPTADQNITKRYKTSSEENARKRFARELQRDSTWLWENRIGDQNVYVQKGWD